MTSTEQLGASAYYCDFVLEHYLEQIRPTTIVDFGAGGGKNGLIARRVLGDACEVIGVEGFERSANTLRAGNVYNRVDCALLQDWITKEQGKYAMAVFGDVLEHLAPSAIHASIRSCLGKFDHILIVCPLWDIFQSAAYGNELEKHKTYVTMNFFDKYRPISKCIVEGDDYTIMSILIDAHRQKQPLTKRAVWAAFHVLMLSLQPIGLARPAVDAIKYVLRGRAGRFREQK
jgi:hypothetical protein